MIFSQDQSEFITTYHAAERTDRLKKELTPEDIIQLAKGGKVILDTRDHRYIQSGDLRFPCVKENGKFIIKSIISKDMYMTAKE
ncbi:hypothetical protein J2Z48_001946 [Croceifilum oryzae]|uniref:Uncharacterized protein n=1 Tax=Croceifilum oryzae TaxID=1553429 RepID=A0AAJ1WSV0_9BACL|nr:hypothetical protein [Croceifilum oryzae]MDQ0417773.1 hypothetical protein [Croceifilum oryzae]